MSPQYNNPYDWEWNTTATTVWPQWNQQTAGITGSYPQVTSASGAWTIWIDNRQVYASPGQTLVWQDWNSVAITPAPTGPLTQLPGERAVLAPDPRLVLVRRNRDRAHKLRRKFTERRADQLLTECLTPEQLHEWEASNGGHFHVVTAGGTRRYRIDRGHAGNIRLVGCDGEPPRGKSGYPIRIGARFCMHGYHPDGWIPDGDHMLAQKLLLEADEAEFLRLANVS